MKLSESHINMCKQYVRQVIESNTWKDEVLKIDGIHILQLWTSDRKYAAIKNIINNQWVYVPTSYC
jgi:hypothetical protein